MNKAFNKFRYFVHNMFNEHKDEKMFWENKVVDYDLRTYYNKNKKFIIKMLFNVTEVLIRK